MTSTKIIGLILAGGRSLRMGGNDKAFVTLAGKPLLAHALTRLQPQVDEVAINSNADPAHFRAFGVPVISDRLGGYLGPLAGIHAGLSAYPDDYLLTVAVDLPFLPMDLASKLRPVIDNSHCAYASNGAIHALTILWPPGMAPRVESFLRQGQHRLGDWLALHGRAVVFAPTANSDILFNINTPEHLTLAELALARAEK